MSTRQKKFVTVLIFMCIIILPFTACKKGGESSSKKGGDVLQKGHVDLKSDSPFSKIVQIFSGFNDLVVQYKDVPSEGVQACRKYTNDNIPKIQLLEKDIGKYESESEYLNLMIETNNRIKEITDSITKTVTENYGMEGVDILIQLSDMALARL